MQPDDGIKKSPYKGIFIMSFFLIMVPVVFYLMVKVVVDKYQGAKYGEELSIYTGLIIGCGLGFFFQLGCIIGGLFRGTFRVVLKRVINFIDNLSISFRFARKMYVDDLKEDGAVFWILFIIVGSTLAAIIYGLINAIALF